MATYASAFASVSRISNLLPLLALLVFTGCTQVGERTELSVGYYDISGNSFKELDQQISLHGPRVEGVGKALAATRIRMVPVIRFRKKNGLCMVSHARVKVKARVTLPRLSSSRKLRQELELAWQNLEKYARIHEAIHVAIADQFAVRIENAVKSLPPQENCSDLEDTARQLAGFHLQLHEAEQLKFDAEEKIRIDRLISRTKPAS